MNRLTHARPQDTKRQISSTKLLSFPQRANALKIEQSLSTFKVRKRFPTRLSFDISQFLFYNREILDSTTEHSKICHLYLKNRKMPLYTFYLWNNPCNFLPDSTIHCKEKMFSYLPLTSNPNVYKQIIPEAIYLFFKRILMREETIFHQEWEKIRKILDLYYVLM